MSRLKMIGKDGSYLHISFKSKGKIWKLIGVESSNTFWDTVDTFKSEDGIYKNVMRKQIFDLCQNKKIEALP